MKVKDCEELLEVEDGYDKKTLDQQFRKLSLRTSQQCFVWCLIIVPWARRAGEYRDAKG